MDDKIKIAAELDLNTEKAMKDLKDLKKRMEDMRVFSDGGPMSQAAGNRGGAAGQRMEDTRTRINSFNRKNLLNDLKNQETQMDKIIKKAEKNQSILDKGVSSQTKLNKLKQEQINLEKQMGAVSQQMAATHSNIQAYGPDRGAGFGGFSGRDTSFVKKAFAGGARRGIGAIGRVAMRNPVMAGGAMLAAAGTAIQTGGRLAYELGTVGERSNIAEATTANNMLGEVSRLQGGKKGYELSFFKNERIDALKAAEKNRKYTQGKDITDLAGATGIGAGVGAIGGLPGMAVGGAMAFGMKMTDERTRSMVFDRDHYNKLLDAESSEVYAKQLAANKSKNFQKIEAMKYFQKKSGAFLKTQRQAGLTDKELFEGGSSILRGGAEEGFTEDIMMQNMNAMSAAGGTKAAVMEGAIGSAKMARNLNLTNAPQLMGKISGRTGGGGVTSQEELIKVYAKAMSIGLDMSNYAKESRELLTKAVDFSYRSGVGSGAVADVMNLGVATKSSRGVEAAASAFKNLSSKTSSMGGLTGQYQIASLSQMKLRGKGLERNQIAALSGKGVEEITLDDDYIKGMLLERNIPLDSQDAKDFVAKLRKDKGGNINRTQEQDKAYVDMFKAKQALSADPDNKKLKNAYLIAKSKATGVSSKVEGESFTKQDLLTQESGMLQRGGVLSGAGQKNIDTEIAAIKKKMKEGAVNLGDKKIRREADDTAASLSLLADKLPDVTGGFDKAGIAAINLATAFGRLAEAMDKNDTHAATASRKAIEKYQGQVDRNRDSRSYVIEAPPESENILEDIFSDIFNAEDQ